MNAFKKFAFLSLLLSFPLLLFSQEGGYGKGMCFDLGIGWMPVTNYPGDTQTGINALASMPGVTEVQINLNLDIGFFLWENIPSQLQLNRAPTRNYLIFGIDGYATRLQDDIGSLQLNNYIFGVGLESVTGGWLARVIIGPASCVVQASADGITESGSSSPGVGVATKLGYDFNTRKGFGLCLALNADLSWIESEPYSALGLSVSVTYF
jgi:hypothetical protein